jgi:hypothetical protein
VIAVAISLNILIALFCFYVAWRLWRLQQTLSTIADALLIYERNTHNTLNPDVIPPAILLGQSGTARLRQHYARWQRQLQQLRKFMFIIGLLPSMGRRLRGFSQAGHRTMASPRTKRYR